jgi:hypothetical protein
VGGDFAARDLSLGADRDGVEYGEEEERVRNPKLKREIPRQEKKNPHPSKKRGWAPAQDSRQKIQGKEKIPTLAKTARMGHTDSKERENPHLKSDTFAAVSASGVRRPSKRENLRHG